MTCDRRSRISPFALWVLAVSTLTLPAYTCAADQEAPNDVTIGKRFTLYSDTLGEEREYLVYVPRRYDDEEFRLQAYPVLYLLDARRNFASATGVIDFMSSITVGNLRVPEHIVVAIRNTNRLRDMTPTHSTIDYLGEENDIFAASGGGDDFLLFLENELIPEIDTRYRTLPHRTLVGHSLGGLIALHALVDKPDLFQAYLAIDPSLWWDDQELLQRAERVFANDNNRKASVYISTAHEDNPEPGQTNRMFEYGQRFSQILESQASSGIRVTFQHFDTEDHGSVALLGLYHGLLAIFDGYRVPVDELVDDPNYLLTHFENLSDMLGFEFPPPESLVNRLGFTMLYGLDEPEKAKALFELNVANNPDSFNVYDSLGEAYLALDERELAIESFEKSLEINPTYSNSIKRLKELTE